jgi:phosphoribosylformimino-5-aminoimidazole carboxamide ribotide isomerase
VSPLLPETILWEQIEFEKMTKFRPCIDLHSGQVKQIVGGTLSDRDSDLKTNYVSKLPASHYAELYREHELRGGHVVMLGPGNDEAAKEALRTWPGGLQVAGGINDKNAQYWIDQGADKVGLLTLVVFGRTICALAWYNESVTHLYVGYNYLLPFSRRKVLS